MNSHSFRHRGTNTNKNINVETTLKEMQYLCSSKCGLLKHNILPLLNYFFMHILVIWRKCDLHIRSILKNCLLFTFKQMLHWHSNSIEVPPLSIDNTPIFFFYYSILNLVLLLHQIRTLQNSLPRFFCLYSKYLFLSSYIGFLHTPLYVEQLPFV